MTDNKKVLGFVALINVDLNDVPCFRNELDEWVILNVFRLLFEIKK
jgi:hypothetical protein